MKPIYKIPSMADIESIDLNGFNVVSTFSGGGGSCLGYRMAGYKVLYANEFIQQAQNTYRANHNSSFLDTRDIRKVSADDILKIVKMRRGEVDLFDGSPPCASFSTAGVIDKAWGKEKCYSGTRQRVDDLFFEYCRILKDLQPKVFVAENVSGLIKGKSKGYFKIILKELKSCGYNVKTRLLNSMWLGVPQKRERLIFVGVRDDINIQPTFPKPYDYYYTLCDAFDELRIDETERQYLLSSMNKYKTGSVLRKMQKNPTRVICGGEVANGSYFNLKRESMYQPCSTICQASGNVSRSGNCHPLEDRKFTIGELKRITSIPDDFVLTGTYEQQWERLGRMVPPMMMYNIAKTIEKEILCTTT